MEAVTQDDVVANQPGSAPPSDSSSQTQNTTSTTPATTPAADSTVDSTPADLDDPSKLAGKALDHWRRTGEFPQRKTTAATQTRTTSTPASDSTGARADGSKPSPSATPADADTTADKTTAPEADNTTKPTTPAPAPRKREDAEFRKRELGREISGLLETRKKLNDEIAALKTGKETPASTPAAIQTPAPAPSTVADLVEPNIRDFDDFFKYDAAQKQYHKKVLAAQKSELTESFKSMLADHGKSLKEQTAAERAAEAAKSRDAGFANAWKTQTEESRKRHEDFDESVTGSISSGLPISAFMDDWIVEHPNGAEVLYELGSNYRGGGDLAAKLAKMPEGRAREALAVLAYQIESRIKGNGSGAKPTPTPVPAIHRNPRNVTTDHAPSADEAQAAEDRGDYALARKIRSDRELKAHREKYTVSR